MSRVKIKDIYYDGEIDDSSEKVKNIEVVPRKIVEMIIAKCESDRDTALNLSKHPYQDILFNRTCASEAANIRMYAKSLLRQFEGDD